VRHLAATPAEQDVMHSHQWGMPHKLITLGVGIISPGVLACRRVPCQVRCQQAGVRLLLQVLPQRWLPQLQER
jgi:hypothetical protein